MFRVTSIGAILALVAIVASVPSSVAMKTKSRTIEEINVTEKRFVLYNSRRLTGECLDICVTKNPTASPTIEAAAATADPSTSPTAAICEEKRAIDVCLAIDNSGSVCSSGSSPQLCYNCNANQSCKAGEQTFNSLCCGNYEHLTTFASNYIDNLGEGTFSVVKFGTTANVISPQGTEEDAKTAIATSAYTGGYTNTDDAIYRCKNELAGKPNPVIVLITDGTPTACRKKGGGYKTISDSGCSSTSCNGCINGAPLDAAIAMADEASDANMSVVPVVINSISRSVEKIERLARCPKNDSGCNVNDYKGIQVDDIDEVDELLKDLVLSTGCQ